MAVQSLLILLITFLIGCNAENGSVAISEVIDKDSLQIENMEVSYDPQISILLATFLEDVQIIELPVIVSSSIDNTTGWIKLSQKEAQDLLPKELYWRAGSEISATGKISLNGGNGILFNVNYPTIDIDSPYWDYQDTTSYLVLVTYNDNAEIKDYSYVGAQESCSLYAQLFSDKIIALNRCEMEDIHFVLYTYSIDNLLINFRDEKRTDFERTDTLYFKKAVEYQLKHMGNNHQIKGVVADATTRQPIDSVLIKSGDYWASSILNPKTTLSDSIGHFQLVFKSLENDSCKIEISHPDFRTKKIYRRNSSTDTIFMEKKR